MLRYIGFALVCSGVLLIVISIVLIFVLNVPAMLDELSGRKAKRQIKRLKELNVGTGSFDTISTSGLYNVSTGTQTNMSTYEEDDFDVKDNFVSPTETNDSVVNNSSTSSESVVETPKEVEDEDSVSTNYFQETGNDSADLEETANTNFLGDDEPVEEDEDEVATDYFVGLNLGDVLNSTGKLVILEEQTSLKEDIYEKQDSN